MAISSDVAGATAALEQMLRAEMGTWDDQVWATPSHCPGWTLKSVVVHLIQVAELIEDSVRRGLAGDAGPPAAAADIPAWRAARARRLEAELARPPAELLARYDAALDALHAAFAAAAGASPARRGWHPAGSQPLAWFPDQWLFELALHDWDMRVGLEPAAELRPLAVPAFMATLPPRLPRWFDAAKLGGARGRVRLALAEGTGAGFAVEVGDGGLTFVAGPAGGHADATIETDGAACGLVMTFRRPYGYYAERGRWRIAGDRGLGERFSGAFRAV